MAAKEPEIDLDALAECSQDMASLMRGGREAAETERRVLSQEQQQIREHEEARMTTEEKAARSKMEAAYAAKVRDQKAQLAEKEAAADATRRADAKSRSLSTPGVMGVGRVPVDVGSVESAFEYELELTDVTIWVPLPPGARAKELSVDVGASSLAVGLKGRPPYLKGVFKGRVREDEAVWTIEAGQLKLELSKAGQTGVSDRWDGCLELPEGWACEWHSE